MPPSPGMSFMSAPKVFIDTNILVYAHDATAGHKQERAREALVELWDNHTGVLSTQVLQELFISLTQKIPQPLEDRKVRRILEDLCAWEVVVNDEQAIFAAIDIQSKYRLSFWDSLILDAARRGGAAILLSEDLSHGQRIGGLTIVNPFTA